ncbi:MAG: hypothetical protein ABIQ18_08870 [Umezawaea sp.]
MSNLENRYRRLLRVLPRWYRAEREEEMVGLFLADRTDDLDLEHGWPGWGETGATLALAARARLGVVGGPPRAAVVGEVVRLVALIGLLVQVSYAFTWLGDSLTSTTLGAPGIAGVPLAVNLLLVGGAVAMALGQRAPAKALVCAVAVYGLVVVPLADDGPVAFLSVLWQLPLWMTAAALVLGFHRDAPAPNPWRWRWAMLGVAVAAGAFGAASANWEFFTTLRVTAGELLPLVVLVAGVVHLVRRGPTAPGLAIAVWLLALLPMELFSLRVTLAYPQAPGLAAYLLVRATGLVVIAATLLVVGLRELRRPARAVTP